MKRWVITLPIVVRALELEQPGEPIGPFPGGLRFEVVAKDPQSAVELLAFKLDETIENAAFGECSVTGKVSA